MNLKSTIESLLFVSPKSLKIKQLSKILEKNDAEIKTAIEELIQERANTGVVVLENNGEYQMATNSENSPHVKNFLNAELREKLTDATVEVLAIIAYKQPVSKAEIEAIRGVSSQYSLRHLLMRGIIEKATNPHDARGFLYQTTTEFLQHLGLTSLKELPEFEKLASQVKLPETPVIVENINTESPNPKKEATEANPNSSEASTKEQITETAPTENHNNQEQIPLNNNSETQKASASEESEQDPDEFTDEDDDEDDEE